MRTLSVDAPVRDAMPLANWVGRYIRLAPDETVALRQLQSGTRTIQRGRKLCVQGKRSEEIFIVISGVGIRYRVLRDGRRQIARFVVPGDIEGYGGAAIGNAMASTLALTEMVVVPIRYTNMIRLLAPRPRLLAKLLLSLTCDTSIDVERLVDLGRRSALERVAHFLMELLTRLQAVGLADDHSYQLPLTQELISDALGLSVTHVNRVFQRLRADNLAYLTDQRVVIADVPGLSALADFDPAYLQPRLPGEFFDKVA